MFFGGTQCSVVCFPLLNNITNHPTFQKQQSSRESQKVLWSRVWSQCTILMLPAWERIMLIVQYHDNKFNPLTPSVAIWVQL